MDRRTLLGLFATLPFLRSATAAGPVPPGQTTPQVEELRNGWRALLAKNADVATDATPVTLTADEWRKRLSPAAYNVLREEGTERPGSSKLNDEKRKGVFVCAGCAWPVFTSAMKYESGTGWPSFFTTIPARSTPRSTTRSSTRASSTTARSAAGTTATCSTTGRSRRPSAGATTASRCASFPRSADSATEGPLRGRRAPGEANDTMRRSPGGINPDLAGLDDALPLGDVGGDALREASAACPPAGNRAELDEHVAELGRRHDPVDLGVERTTTSRGVAAGANTPNHATVSKPGRPASAIVGTSGSSAERVSVGHAERPQACPP